ncbi:hypothetical protein Godav_015068, partial [Gossypium davidsonii]|nr:hypothetical protein [Gossypium davidsonii]MBA0650046.1 hypothetical protein [Gossypium klotzschianum]
TKEVKKHLTKNIDKCYNNPSFYQIQAGIDLITKAQYLLQQKYYCFWIDGRRILAYDTGVGYIQDDRNKESVQILKKIADMEIEDLPSHIIKEKKYGKIRTSQNCQLIYYI